MLGLKIIKIKEMEQVIVVQLSRAALFISIAIKAIILSFFPIIYRKQGIHYNIHNSFSISCHAKRIRPSRI